MPSLFTSEIFVSENPLGLCSTTAGEKVILSTGAGVAVGGGRVGGDVGVSEGVMDGVGVDDGNAVGSELGDRVKVGNPSPGWSAAQADVKANKMSKIVFLITMHYPYLWVR